VHQRPAVARPVTPIARQRAQPALDGVVSRAYRRGRTRRIAFLGVGKRERGTHPPTHIVGVVRSGEPALGVELAPRGLPPGGHHVVAR
jgi:hypothetical protein